MRFCTLWDPAPALLQPLDTEEAGFEEQEWELARLEQLKEEQEAEADADEQQLEYAGERQRLLKRRIRRRRIFRRRVLRRWLLGAFLTCTVRLCPASGDVPDGVLSNCTRNC